jgi:predicted chitinase
MKPAISLVIAILLFVPCALSGKSLRGSSYTPVTAQDIKKIMPEANSKKINEYLPHMNEAMQKYGINTPERKAAFLSQVATETGQLNYMTEIASGAAYNGRKDLGNNAPHDGETYKGRGALQLTGKDNYKKAGQALGLDLVNHPELAATPQHAFETAGWYWDHKNLNKAADSSSVSQVTKGVNGCTNCKQTHSEERANFYQNAQKALGGSKSATPSTPKTSSTKGSATKSNNGRTPSLPAGNSVTKNNDRPSHTLVEGLHNLFGGNAATNNNNGGTHHSLLGGRSATNNNNGETHHSLFGGRSTSNNNNGETHHSLFGGSRETNNNNGGTHHSLFGH